MSDRAYRLGMLAGALFPVSLVIGAILLFSGTPNTEDSSVDEIGELWARYLADAGHRQQAIAGCYLFVLAAVLLVWFAATLRSRLPRAGSAQVPLAVLAASALVGAIAGPMSLAGGVEFGGEPAPSDGQLIWTTFGLLFPMLLVAFGLAVAAYVASVLVAGRGVLPAWVTWFGVLAVVAGALGVLFMPMLVVLLWFLVVGGFLAARGQDPAVA